MNWLDVPSAAKRVLAVLLRWRTPSPADAEWLQRKRMADRDFDSRFGVNTGGISFPRDRRIPAEMRRAAVPHIASDPGEFAAKLHLSAALNLRRASAKGIDVSHIELVHCDATRTALPQGPLLLYLYNPFNIEVMRRFLALVLQTLAVAPRPMFVFYVNPFFEALWLEAGFTVRARTGNGVVLVAPLVGDGRRLRPLERVRGGG